MTRDEVINEVVNGLLEGRYTVLDAQRYMSPSEPDHIKLELISTLPKWRFTQRFPIGKYNIKKVIFNAPATVVFWTDGTKTVVKCGEYEVFDPEKGLAMAIAKKALGNHGNYYNHIKKWLPDSIELFADDLVVDRAYPDTSFNDFVSKTIERLNKAADLFNPKERK